MPNTQFLFTQEIHFSQASVSSTFTDGTSVSKLTQDLLSGEVILEDIAAIRVVQYQKKWVTLDNRRLRAFKDAMISKTPVIVCDLKDPDISREFHRKRTNKTSDDGGFVRVYSTTGSTQHFDDGAYVFVKRILNLTLEQLAEPLTSLQRVTSLPTSFDSSSEYYDSFLELILEEACASLQAGIEANVSAENPVFELSFQEYKPPKKAENPAPIIFTKKLDERRVIKAYDAFLLESSASTSIKLVALASYAPSDDSNRISLKVVIEQDVYETDVSAFKLDVKWTAKPLGSLVTHMRMYDVCTARPDIPWMDQLVSGNLQSEISPLEPLVLSQINFSNSNLNASQKEAVAKFLSLEEGIQLVLGPPGTGKTTTIVSLLEKLAENGRTLVCAPSNKAVQVLAERFASAYPHIPAIFVGVEDRLAEDNIVLRKIFIHTWGEQKLEAIGILKEKLWGFLPNNVFLGTAEIIKKLIKFATNDSKRLEEDLEFLLKDFKKYEIEVPDVLDIFKIRIESYVEQMTTTGINLASKKQKILKEDYLDPEKWDQSWEQFFVSIRKDLSEITTSLSRFENWLRSKIEDDSSQGLDGVLLNHSRIIFATLSVSGRKMIKDMLPVNALIIDEAGQAVEAETLVPFVVRPRKCLLIGDTNQLPATVISTEATKFKFDRSLMWRLLKDCNQPYSMLTTQYRMHPDIRHWPSLQYYDGKIQDSEHIALGNRVFIQKPMPRFVGPYAFINVHSREVSSGHSFSNREEADAIAQILQYFQHELSLNVSLQVGVITFYKSQVSLIQTKLSRIFPGVKVNTVDSFQGDENDVIIISCVRSNEMGNIGFVKDFRRLNVALTRAKHSLMVIGNAATLERGERDLALLVRDAKKRNCFFNYEEIQQTLVPIASFSGNYRSRVSDSRDTKDVRQVVCKFDQQKPGSCRHGANCQFLHDRSQSENEGSSRVQAYGYKKKELVKQ